MALTWPGVPVTAWASMRPCSSNAPADRSPASRTLVLKAVRISVKACSSTTEINRFHITWLWMLLIFPDIAVSFLRLGVFLNFNQQTQIRLHRGNKLARHDSGRLALYNNGGAHKTGTHLQLLTIINSRVDEFF